MASHVYGKEVSLPGANHMSGSGGHAKPGKIYANTFIGKTAVPPSNVNPNYSKIAVNGMGKNGTMMTKSVKRNPKKA